MAIFYRIVALLGGLAMFLYGMRIMGDGLKSNSGGTMKTVLAKVTNKPVLGFLLGLIVTCTIQSSTATIVLTVGLVGAEFLTFRQSIGVVMGANVGTAITAQIIRLMDIESSENSIMYFFKADNLAPMALILGIVILMAAKRESKKNIGNVACGFGVLFMGLIFMSDAVAVFRESLSGLLTAFANNYLLGFGTGVLVTGIIQSSSAVIGIVQSVASTMGVTFNGIFAVIIGVNIGDCITTFIVSRIGARPRQIRTAMVHVIYNVMAACLIILLLAITRATGILNDDIWYASLNSGGVANVHGLFRMIPAICLLPFSGLLARITEKIVPDNEEEENEAPIVEMMNNLDDHLLSSPILAMDQVDELVRMMGQVALENFHGACSQMMEEYSEEIQKSMKDREDILDQSTDAAGQYLISMTPYIKQNRGFRLQNYELKSSVCMERIGDACMEISYASFKMKESDHRFSDYAKAEMDILMDAVEEILHITLEAMENRDPEIAKKVEPLEEVIDDISVALNNRHTNRTSRNICDVFSGIQFMNVISNLEKISDQCSTLAVHIQELTQESIRGREHEYIHKLHHSGNGDFQAAYTANREKYITRILDLPMMDLEGGDQELSVTD